MKTRSLVLALFLALTMTGCYLNDEVGTNQKGVRLDENKIQEIVGPGVYSEAWCFFCELKTVDVDTLTFPVEDPEVLTSDNQAVGVLITIQARRKSDDESIKNLLTNWSSLIDNEQLKATISSTAREGLKNGVRGFTLTGLLSDRNNLADAIEEQLSLDVEKYSVEIINITVENIAPSADYMAILAETANLNAQTEQAQRKQALINQQASNDILEQQQRVKVAEAQVLAEQAETDVQVEIAQRAGEVIAAQNAVYTTNPQAYELERLRLLAKVFGDKTMFMPADMVINLLTNSMGPVVPIPQQTQP